MWEEESPSLVYSRNRYYLPLCSSNFWSGRVCRAAIWSFYEGEASWASVIFGQDVTERTRAADGPWSSHGSLGRSQKRGNAEIERFLWQVGRGSWVLAGEISQAPKGSLEQGKNSWGWISHRISWGDIHGCFCCCFVPRVGVWLCFHSSTRERNRGRETQSVCAF